MRYALSGSWATVGIYIFSCMFDTLSGVCREMFPQRNFEEFQAQERLRKNLRGTNRLRLGYLRRGSCRMILKILAETERLVGRRMP